MNRRNTDRKTRIRNTATGFNDVPARIIPRIGGGDYWAEGMNEEAFFLRAQFCMNKLFN